MLMYTYLRYLLNEQIPRSRAISHPIKLITLYVDIGVMQRLIPGTLQLQTDLVQYFFERRQ